MNNKHNIKRMGFAKNNKLGGRKAGSKNKITQNTREQFQDFFNNNFDQFVKDYKAIEEHDKRAMIYLRVTEYILPKLKSVEMIADIVTTPATPAFNIRELYNEIEAATAAAAKAEIKAINSALEDKY